jgi:hypothetical protein
LLREKCQLENNDQIFKPNFQLLISIINKVNKKTKKTNKFFNVYEKNKHIEEKRFK